MIIFIGLLPFLLFISGLQAMEGPGMGMRSATPHYKPLIPPKINQEYDNAYYMFHTFEPGGLAPWKDAFVKAFNGNVPEGLYGSDEPYVDAKIAEKILRRAKWYFPENEETHPVALCAVQDIAHALAIAHLMIDYRPLLGLGMRAGGTGRFYVPSEVDTVSEGEGMYGRRLSQEQAKFFAEFTRNQKDFGGCRLSGDQYERTEEINNVRTTYRKLDEEDMPYLADLLDASLAMNQRDQVMDSVNRIYTKLFPGSDPSFVRNAYDNCDKLRNMVRPWMPKSPEKLVADDADYQYWKKIVCGVAGVNALLHWTLFHDKNSTWASKNMLVNCGMLGIFAGAAFWTYNLKKRVDQKKALYDNKYAQESNAFSAACKRWLGVLEALRLFKDEWGPTIEEGRKYQRGIMALPEEAKTAN